MARNNLATQLDEGCDRCKNAIELGADVTTVVKLRSLEHAKYVARKVPG